VTAILGLVSQAASLIMNLLGLGMGAAAMGEGADLRDQQNAMVAMTQGGVGIALGIVACMVGVVIIVGAMKMKNLRSYSLAMAAAILAMIPCISPCCLLGLPFGIWAIVVLVDPHVKAAFT
jgi:predicted PurR-regulated permease PerM